MAEEYVIVREAAKVIGIDYHTLLARIRRGKVATVKVGKRMYLIHKNEVERLRQIKELQSC